MDIYDINMNKLEFLISRDVKKEYRKTYYSANKDKWIQYKENRKQKLLDLRPVFFFLERVLDDIRSGLFGFESMNAFVSSLYFFVVSLAFLVISIGFSLITDVNPLIFSNIDLIETLVDSTRSEPRPLAIDSFAFKFCFNFNSN